MRNSTAKVITKYGQRIKGSAKNELRKAKRVFARMSWKQRTSALAGMREELKK